MTVAPALTWEEWRRELDESHASLEERILWACDEVSYCSVEPAALMALINHSLPVDHPLKLTSEDVVGIRWAVAAAKLLAPAGVAGGLAALEDKLNALLYSRHIEEVFQMSYSFSVRAKSKADALAAVENELDKVVESQPIHEKDRGAAGTAARAAVEVLAENAEQDVLVSVNGYVSVNGADVMHVSVTVGASLASPVA